MPLLSAIESIRSPQILVRAAFDRNMAALAKIRATCRSGIALFLAASFFAVTAQTPYDTPKAKLEFAARETSEAVELSKKFDPASWNAAITKLQNAGNIYAELGEKKRHIATLFFIGHLQLALDQKEAGTATLNKALGLARETNDPEQQIRILGRLAEYYFKDGKASSDSREQARYYLEEAAKVIEKTEPKPEQISYDAYELLGRVWMSFYNPTNANKAFLSAYQLKKNKPPEESIPAIIKYAEWQIKMGYPKYAIPPLVTAGRKASEAKLPSLEALITWRIGDLMAGTFRDLPNAKRSLERADRLLAANPDEALSAKMMLSWGKYYFATFDLTKAAEYFEKAMNPEARIKPVGLKGEVLLRFGILNFTVGSFERAIQLLEEAAEINGSEGRKLMEMESLRYLARCQNALGRVDDARKTMTKALAARGDSGQGYDSAESVAILIDHSDFFIEAFHQNGKDPLSDIRLTRAKQELDLAYRTAKRELMKEYRAISAQRLALVYSLLGDKAKAIELLNDSLITSRSAGLPVQEASAMTGLLDLSLAMGNTGAAVFYGKSAVNIYQQLRKRIADLTPEERVSYLKTIEGTYRKLASLLIEQGRIAEAEQVLTMLKQEELIEYVRRDDGVAKNMLETLALTGDERAAMTRYDGIAGQITSLGKEYDQLEKERRTFPVGEFPKQKRYDELKQQLADATLVFEKFLDELKIKFGQQDSRVVELDSGLKKMLAGLKADRTAVVSTIVGENTLNIIVTTSKTQRAHTIKVTAKEINELVAKFRTALTSPQYDPRPVGQQLYDLIIKPIEGDLAGIKADTILWSLDGTLRYIPPAALWDTKNGYMAERFANVMINLASRDDVAKDRTTGQLSVLGVGVSKPTEGFSALTAVPDELDCIVADKAEGILSAKPQCKNGVLAGRKLLDEKFTLSTFEGEIGRYPIIHIASHFKLTPGDDKNSFLLLGGGADRKFTVEKLRSEPLTDVDLIVLSACNTATPGGARANGVEVEGFGSIAQKEGARSVMATLWSVADTSTKDFMVEFYKLYGKVGASKADAMRRAQMKLMNGKYSPQEAVEKRRADTFVQAIDASLPRFNTDLNAPFAHPFYWSPFILIGNWQ